MKKLHCSTNRFFATFLLVALFGMFGAMRANADTQVEFGKPFTIEESNNYEIFYITVPETGTLYLEVTPPKLLGNGASNFSILFTDPECMSPLRAYGEPKYNRKANSYTYAFAVEGGKTYYISHREGIVYDPITITLTMSTEAIKPEVVSTFPECGNDVVYNFARGFELQVLFNISDVKCDGVVMRYTTTTGEVKSIEMDYIKLGEDGTWRIDVKRAIDTVKDELERGGKFWVVIQNVTADGEGPTGEWAQGNDIVLPFVYEPMTVATNMVWPEKFLSYWPEGDPAGIAVITFDGDLAPLSEQPKGGADKEGFAFKIFAGNDRESEDGMQPLPDGKITIEGNVLTLDFTGVTRNTDKTMVTIMVQSMVDASGKPIFYNANSAIDVEIEYVKLDQITLTYDITPSSGSLNKVDEIEIWLDNETFEHMTFEGFEFICGETSEIVPMESCDQKADPDDPYNFTLIYVPVPEAAKSAPEVTMNAIIKSLDGNDYELSATYQNETQDDTNGVNGIEADNENQTIYNLQGVKVNGKNVPAGVYIVNGKKVLKIK